MRITSKDKQELDLSILFTALAQGQHIGEVRRRYNLSRKTASVLRGAFISTHPDRLPKFQSQEVRARIGRRSPENRPLRFLVDECVSPAVTYYVSRYLGWATHIDFKNMNGTKDPEVYQYAIDEGFDAIITRDRAETGPCIESKDLTDIALGHALAAREAERKGDGFVQDTRFKHPILIHISGTADWDNIKQRIKSNKFDILSAIESRESPILILGRRHVYLGPTYQEIFHEANKPDPETLGLRKQAKVQKNPRQGFIDKMINATEQKNGRNFGRKVRRTLAKQYGALWDQNNNVKAPSLAAPPQELVP